MALMTLTGGLPEPSAYMQGGLYRLPGEAGAADRVVTCLKLADDTYAWVDLALAPVDAYTKAEADARFAAIDHAHEGV